MRPLIRQIIREHGRWLLLLSLTWCLYLSILFGNMLEMRPDGLYAGHPYVWADWALHMGMARLFAFHDPLTWFSNHPVYAGAPLNYTFLTNLISGLLLKAGAGVDVAFLWPSIFFSWALCFGLYGFFVQFCRSRGVAYLAVCLFFFSSGLGFINFFKEFFQTWDFNMFLLPPKEYSRFMEYEWGSGNVLVGMLVPQRAFLLGLTLAIWSLTLYLFAMTRNVREKYKLLVWGGLIGGLLPVAHAHSLMAVTILLAFTGLIFLRDLKTQLWFFIPYFALAGLLHTIFLRGAVNTENFGVWQLGWTAHSVLGWITQWTWQWGLTIPAAIAGSYVVFWRRTPDWRTALAAGFFFLFVLSNLYRFQPMNWDNSKIFLWCFVGFSGLSAMLCAYVWNIRATWARLTACALVFVLAFTGVLETVKLFQTASNSYRMISTEDIKLSDEIREKTPQNSRFLTAPVHDHPIMVWATRPLIMGYTAWVINYGFPYQQREEDMRKMFEGDTDLLKKYKVSYVVADPASLKMFHVNLDFYSKFPIAFQSNERRIFDVRTLTGAE